MSKLNKMENNAMNQKTKFIIIRLSLVGLATIVVNYDPVLSAILLIIATFPYLLETLFNRSNS